MASQILWVIPGTEFFFTIIIYLINNWKPWYKPAINYQTT